MPYGTHKLLGAASTAAAWKDWRTIHAWCEQNGHSELASQHAPKEGAGHKTVDKQIEKLRVALGAVAGAWENVLDGLTPAQQTRTQKEESLMPRRTNKTRQAIDDAEAAWLAAFRANREEADRRLQAEGLSHGELDPHKFPNRWDQLFDQVCKERPLPPHPLRVQEDLQTGVRGAQLLPDEQRYVLELFPESRATLKLSPEQWLEQTAFRLRKNGTLDLRHRYCRINPGAGPEEEYRYHRAPRYRPLPPPPQRQE